MTDRDIFKRHVLPFRRRLIAALIGTGCFTILSLLQPLLLRYLIDSVIKPGRWNLLGAATAAILLIPVTAAVVRMFNSRLIILTARRFIARLRILMYRKLLGLSQRYHGNNSAGAVVGRLMDDVNRVQRLLTADTLQMLVDIVVFAFAITILFKLSWKLGAVVLAILSLYLLAYRIFSARIRDANTAYRGIFDSISGRLQETLTGIRHMRIYDTEGREETLFQSRTAEGLERQLDSSMSSTTLGTICSAIAGYGSTIVCGLGAWMILRGEITYGDLYAIDSYVWMAIHPVIRLTTISAQLAETGVSMRRIADVFREPFDIASPARPLPVRTGPGAVDFKRITFSYSPDRPLFKGLDLHVDPGMMIALAGHTGCGKTSLTSLLMRYWDVQDGSIEIDGLDVRSMNLAELRGRFGVVMQQPILFEGTVAANIAYGRPDAPRREIEEAADMAEIHDAIAKMPKGYDTQLGTAGIKLSLGEKQRMAIARAILRNPVFFVMDEATSALDSESESLIQKALRRVLRGRTSFIIAHRLSTITRADLIVVMDHGRIVETGSHASLSGRPGSVYQSFCKHLRESS